VRSRARRRFLRILAAAGGLSFLDLRDDADAGAPLVRWEGSALGARASLILAHPEPEAARALIASCVAEIARLERIFSLFDPASALSRLNRTGRLDGPPLELLMLLSEAEAVRGLSDGAFDVRVQPLWEAYAGCVGERLDLDGPEARARLNAASRLLRGGIDAGPAAIVLERPGMRLTFNGIAQGFVTDRVADLLRAEGIRDILLDLGEIRGVGERARGRPWRVALAAAADAAIIELSDGALATSDPLGTCFDRSGRHHHLFDPITGRSATRAKRITVLAPTATLADAVSTALAVDPNPTVRRRAERLADVRIIGDDTAQSGTEAPKTAQRGHAAPTWLRAARYTPVRDLI
jgi:FAD:protein FMN transferase